MVKRVVTAMVWLRRHPIIRALLVLTTVTVMTLVLVGGTFLLAMKGRDIRVPQVVQDRIAAEIAASVTEVSVAFSDVTVGLTQNWQPQLNFHQLAVSQGDLPPFLSLSTVAAQVSLDHLARGDLRVTHIAMEGASIALKRSQEGELTLRFGTLDTTGSTDFDLFAVLEAMDIAAQGDAFSAFDRFELNGLTVQYDDLRAEQSFLVDGARLAVSRVRDEILIRSDMALLNGGVGVSTLELNYKSPIGTRAAEFGILLTDMPADTLAGQSSILAWLSPLQATISGALRGGLTDAAQLMPLNGTLQISKGVLQPNDTVKPIPFDGARTYFSFKPDTQEIVFSDISVNSRDITLSATGYSLLASSLTGDTEFTGQLSVTKLDANPFTLFPDPITTDEARLDFRLTLDPFTVSLPRIYIKDKASKSQVIAQADLTADATGWNVGLSANIPQVDVKTILGYWPRDFKDKPREWVEKNVHRAQMHDVTFSMRLQNQQPPVASTSFWFDEADVTVMPDMPKVMGASGLFSSYDFRTSVSLTKGTMTAAGRSAVDLAGSTFVIPDSRVKPSPARVDIETKGAIGDILSLLNAKPFLVLDRLNRDADFVAGQAIARAQIDLVLKKGIKAPDVRYGVTAQLKNVSSDTLVPDRQLRAENLDLTIDKDVLTIRGLAALNAVSGAGTYQAYLGPTYTDKPATLTVDAKVGADDLARLGIALPSWLISGQAAAQFTATFAKGQKPTYRVASDLVGARVSVPQLSWTKPANTAARFSAAGRFDGTNLLENLSFSGAGATIEGRGSFQNSKFTALTLTRAELGPAFKGALEIAAGNRINVTGGRSDLSAFLKRLNTTSAAGTGTSTTITARLDRLDVTDSIRLTNLDIAMNGSGRGTFTGLVNGAARINGTLARKNGVPSVQITANDAGKTLVAAGFLKRASSGSLTLDLVGTGRAGEMDGTLSVTEIRIQNAPILIELLNAVSVVGLLDQLSGPGLTVSEINAKFRNTPRQIIVENASMFGPSIGMTVDGYYTKDSKALDFQGVLSPLYILNGIGSIFSKKGEGLIGFNFNVGGSADTPRIGVNPLSIFTPAMFREIFRRPAPKLE